MFVYCRDVLHLSEPEAYLRIAVARASREHPMLLTMLADGRLHLTAIDKLAPHLTRANRDGLLQRATHRTKRQIEELIAEIAPLPDVPALLRKLPDRTQLAVGQFVIPNGGSDSMLPGTRLTLRPDAVVAPTPSGSGLTVASRVSASVVQPLSPGRYKVQFTASAEFQAKLRRLQALMGPGVTGGDLAAVIEQAITEKLERLEARRFARTGTSRKGPQEAKTRDKPPSPELGPLPGETRLKLPCSSRYIPAAVRRAVHERDGGRCRFVDEQGRRCPESDQIEFHHRHPFGLGGDHSVTNVRLMCRAHNAYLAEYDFGREAMASHRRPHSRASPAPGG
jgi:hypothetical protein